MKLVQIFLPLYDNEGKPFTKTLFDTVRESLTQQFGGVTAFVRSPAVGAWENGAGEVRHDDVVLFEIMVDSVDHDWWKTYRHNLELQFSQETILIRATEVELL